MTRRPPLLCGEKKSLKIKKKQIKCNTESEKKDQALPQPSLVIQC